MEGIYVGIIFLYIGIPNKQWKKIKYVILDILAIFPDELASYFSCLFPYYLLIPLSTKL